VKGFLFRNFLRQPSDLGKRVVFFNSNEKSVDLNVYKRVDIRSVVLCRGRKVSKADDIPKEMIAYLGADAVEYSMVTKYVGSASFAPETPDTLFSEEFNMIDETILKALEYYSFQSVSWQGSRPLHRARSTDT
jgi:hypothetical protein